MRLSLFSSCLFGALAFGGMAYAHHGWGSYDAGKKFSMTGSIEKVEWQNPHVHVMIQHEGKPWEAVLAPPFRMSARGLEPDMLKPGTAITLEGYPSTRVATEMRAERLVADGKTYELR